MITIIAQKFAEISFDAEEIKRNILNGADNQKILSALDKIVDNANHTFNELTLPFKGKE